MQNLIKVDCSGFVIKKASYTAPLNSAWDDSAASGNLVASQQTTGKAGTGGSGSGITADFTTNGTPIISEIEILANGAGYVPGDVITFSFTAADAIASGSFDVTLTIPADGAPITYRPADDIGGSETGVSTRYIDAGVCVGLGTISFSNGEPFIDIRTNRVQTATSSQSTQTISYRLLIAGLNPFTVGTDGADIVRAASEISECLKDAWQNPNSLPELNSYLSEGSVANVYLTTDV